MRDRVSSLDETLASLQADRDARRFHGTEFEEAVLRHARDVPTWEIAECWRYPEWPARTTVGVPLPSHDAGIDLVAVKHDGSRVRPIQKSPPGWAGGSGGSGAGEAGRGRGVCWVRRRPFRGCGGAFGRCGNACGG